MLIILLCLHALVKGKALKDFAKKNINICIFFLLCIDAKNMKKERFRVFSFQEDRVSPSSSFMLRALSSVFQLLKLHYKYIIFSFLVHIIQNTYTASLSLSGLC